MLGTLRKILSLLTESESNKLYWLVIAIIMMAAVDMIGIASIFPFLSVISDPGAIETNAKLKMVYDNFSFTNKNAFLVALGGVTFVLLVLSNVTRAFVNIALLRFTWTKRYTISRRLLSQYLSEPYSFFLNRNSADLVGYLISEVAKVVSDVLIPCMQIFARSVLALLVLGLLFMVDYVVATVVLFVMGGGYVMIYVFAKKKLSLSGEEGVTHNQKILYVLNEVFGGIKDVKLLGKEQVYIDQYSYSLRKLVRCYTNRFLVAQYPRYAFEVIAFGGILFIITYLIIVQKDYQKVIPLVGLYAFAALRLMPTLQMIFQDATSIRFGLATLDRVHRDFFNCTVTLDQRDIGPVEPLPFKRIIRLENLTFTYPKAKNAVIKEFSLAINANTTIGFVGETGAGKTTVIDIFLGLLQPVSGRITVDEVPLTLNNIRRWQRNIGYVSQHIFLSDDTVERNIAFGVNQDSIDHQAVIQAAKLANIHEFVTTQLPDGYKTKVGERGIRLSGGQRQRIGIARALYYNPSVLVFDEATSALDGTTESVIISAINNLAHKKTIIIIAHRLTSVKKCDMIYLMENGKIIANGKYDELLKGSNKFQKMVHDLNLVTNIGDEIHQ